VAIVRRLADADRGNDRWESELATHHDSIGDMLAASGDHTGALAEYRKGMALRRTIIERHDDISAKAEWRRYIALSHDKIGGMLAAVGDIGSAVHEQGMGCLMRRQLVADDPGNTELQRELAISHETGGDLLAAAGDHTGALFEYQGSLKVFERIVDADPGNDEWLNDLNIITTKIDRILKSNKPVSAGLHGGHVGDETDEFLAVAGQEKISPVTLRKIIDEAKAADGEVTARGTTSRSATAKPRPDWVEARKSADGRRRDSKPIADVLAAFIRDKFADELADGTMSTQKLYRYEKLYSAFFNHRDKLPPDLRDMPRRSELNDRMVAEGKVRPEPPGSDYYRQRSQVRAARQRGVVAP
jgi:hypothetical protein